MANEIQAVGTHGTTVYAIVRSATGTVWRTDTHVFEAYATANLANYTISLTEQGTASCFFVGTFPTALTTAGMYSVVAYQQAGGSPAEGDTPIAVGTIDWNGAAVQRQADVEQWKGTAVTAGAIPNAAAGASGGLFLSGTNTGPVSISGGLTVSNSGGTAVIFSSTGNGGNGLTLSGNGSGGGAVFLAGSTGDGLQIAGGASSGDGIYVATTSGNGINLVPIAGHGLLATGNGTGKHGISAVGSPASGTNAGGHGIAATGGAAATGAGGTAGAGIKGTGGAGAASGNGAGEGMTLVGGGTTTVSGANGLSATGTGNLNGFALSGAGSGDGLAVTGGATGRGLHALGGATSGAAIRAEAQNGNSPGFHGLGNGTGAGLEADGGATGPGQLWVGGASSGAGLSVTTTSGDGFSITPTAGNGITCTANGTSKHGFVITGGTAGTSDGLKCVAGTGGVDIRGAITGSITGNLSGSVGSVTGAVGSVTGAVGSVTGNVGGNVVGSVGSVTAAVTLSAGDSPVIATGTATAGGASTITLQTALGTDNIVNGCKIKITSGTGAKQCRTIIGYVNSTQVATVDHAWTTNPDATSVYAVFYDDAPKLDSSLQVTAGSTGGTITANVTQWNGHAVPAENVNGLPKVDVVDWLGSKPNALISGRVDANAGVIGDKTGYILGATGLDSIPTTQPTGVASTFREMIVQTWRRFFRRTVYDSAATTIKTYQDDGTTVATTQTATVSGTVQDVGPAT